MVLSVRIINFRLNRVFILTWVSLSGSTFAGLHFDPAMLSDEPHTVADLSRFESGHAQVADSYPVNVYLNGTFLRSESGGKYRWHVQICANRHPDV
ncbi:FimD/PapC N-terminal domain-containing protein [Hafnia paralvei]|uniref:FimD/PapC N-terminal domain-containing protein n=1 Tax=Hafnia paralvei TaxID=546367 RepID=UPI00300C1F69